MEEAYWTFQQKQKVGNISLFENQFYEQNVWQKWARV